MNTLGLPGSIARAGKSCRASCHSEARSGKAPRGTVRQPPPQTCPSSSRRTPAPRARPSTPCRCRGRRAAPARRGAPCARTSASAVTTPSRAASRRRATATPGMTPSSCARPCARCCPRPTTWPRVARPSTRRPSTCPIPCLRGGMELPCLSGRSTSGEDTRFALPTVPVFLKLGRLCLMTETRSMFPQTTTSLSSLSIMLYLQSPLQLPQCIKLSLLQ